MACASSINFHQPNKKMNNIFSDFSFLTSSYVYLAPEHLCKMLYIQFSTRTTFNLQLTFKYTHYLLPCLCAPVCLLGSFDKFSPPSTKAQVEMDQLPCNASLASEWVALGKTIPRCRWRHWFATRFDAYGHKTALPASACNQLRLVSLFLHTNMK